MGKSFCSWWFFKIIYHSIIIPIKIYLNIMIMNWKVKFYFFRWMFKLSEWVHFSSYDVGLNSGSSASHILVCTYLILSLCICLYFCPYLCPLFVLGHWMDELVCEIPSLVSPFPSDFAHASMPPDLSSQTSFFFFLVMSVIAFYRCFLEVFLIGNKSIIGRKGQIWRKMLLPFTWYDVGKRKEATMKALLLKQSAEFYYSSYLCL